MFRQETDTDLIHTLLRTRILCLCSVFSQGIDTDLIHTLMIRTPVFMQGLHTSKTDLIHTLITRTPNIVDTELVLQSHTVLATRSTSCTLAQLLVKDLYKETHLCSVAHLMRTVNGADILGVPSPPCAHERHMPGSKM